MNDWNTQPRSLNIVHQLLETLASLRRIELLSKLKQARQMYAARTQLEQARATQPEKESPSR